MDQKPFDAAVSDIRSTLVATLPGLRASIVTAEENGALVVPDGMDAASAQSEMIELVMIALRHVEDAANRLEQAALVHGETPAPAAATAGAAPQTASAPQGDQAGQ